MGQRIDRDRVCVFHRYELCEFNEDHNVAEWFDSGLALDLASEEYLTFEQGISLTARKVARVTLLFPIRSLFWKAVFPIPHEIVGRWMCVYASASQAKVQFVRENYKKSSTGA